MKLKLISILAVLTVLFLAGCSNDKQRIDYITETYKTNEIFVAKGESSFYIVRLHDGSVWIMGREDDNLPADQTVRQIFSPNK